MFKNMGQLLGLVDVLDARLRGNDGKGAVHFVGTVNFVATRRVAFQAVRAARTCLGLHS